MVFLSIFSELMNEVPKFWMIEKLSWHKWTFKICSLWLTCKFLDFLLMSFFYDEMIILRYYATFKVRKFESLFYKTDTYLQKTTTWIWLQADQILSVNFNICIFSILSVAFAVPFPSYFQKLQFLLVKNFGITFDALHFYLYELKVSQISNWIY